MQLATATEPPYSRVLFVLGLLTPILLVKGEERQPCAIDASCHDLDNVSLLQTSFEFGQSPFLAAELGNASIAGTGLNDSAQVAELGNASVADTGLNESAQVQAMLTPRTSNATQDQDVHMPTADAQVDVPADFLFQFEAEVAVKNLSIERVAAGIEQVVAEMPQVQVMSSSSTSNTTQHVHMPMADSQVDVPADRLSQFVGLVAIKDAYIESVAEATAEQAVFEIRAFAIAPHRVILAVVCLVAVFVLVATIMLWCWLLPILWAPSGGSAPASSNYDGGWTPSQMKAYTEALHALDEGLSQAEKCFSLLQERPRHGSMQAIKARAKCVELFETLPMIAKCIETLRKGGREFVVCAFSPATDRLPRLKKLLSGEATLQDEPREWCVRKLLRDDPDRGGHQAYVATTEHLIKSLEIVVNICGDQDVDQGCSVEA